MPEGLLYRHAKACPVVLLSLMKDCLLPPNALNLVEICLATSPHLRRTVEQLANHPFLGIQGVNEAEAQENIAVKCRSGTSWQEQSDGKAAETAVCGG